MSRVMRLLTDAAWLFWFGGLSFYMIVVVPIGGELLGADVQGEVTSEVTGVVNVVALVAAMLVGLEGWRRGERGTVWASAVILLFTCGLIALRRVMLSRMPVGPDAVQAGPEDWSFYTFHRGYLWLTTVQWISGVIVMWQRAKLLEPRSATRSQGKSGP